MGLLWFKIKTRTHLNNNKDTMIQTVKADEKTKTKSHVFSHGTYGNDPFCLSM